MASLTSILPRPKREFTTQQHDPLLAFGAEAQTTTTPTKKAVGPPPYGQRKGWIPRTPEDFGDGGAFPECHVAQYPLDMGNKEKQSSRALTLVTNAQGEVEYDAIAKYGQREGKIVYSKYTDLIEKRDIKDSDLAKPTPEQEEETARKTKEALEKIVNVKISSTHIASAAKQEVAAPTYVRYTSQQSAQSGADSRILRIVEMPKDPLEPPKFGHKKAPRGPPSPPAPVMHSPPRKLTVKDMANWKIPPCISNWKNAKGYTIPLDKRLAADGRGLQQVQINDGFAKLTEALYIAERTAREEVEHRAQIRKKVALKQKEERDEELRMLAQKARLTRQGGTISATPSAAGGADRGEARGAESPAATERPSRRAASPDEEEIETPEEREARLRRDKLRAERAKEIEYEMKKAARKQSSKTRDEDRDVTEKIALGQAAGPRSTESLFDTRLFNQTSGMDSGFGDDDTYAVYDKPLFKGSQTSQIYRPTKQAYDPYAGMGEEEASEGLKNKFRPNKDFSGVDRSAPSAPRTEPVQFEKQDDPFGLGEILGGSSSASAAGEDSTDARKRPLDKIGRGGFMSASAGGGAARDEDQLSYRDSKRSRIDFKSAGDFKAEDSRDKDDRDRDYDRRDRDDRDRDRDRDYDRRDRDRDRDYDRRRGGDRDRDRDYRDDRRGRDDDRRRR